MNARASLKLLAIAVLSLFGQYAAAQSNPGEWQFTIAPYLIAAGMDGSLAVGQVETEVDVPFDTIINHLEFAAMAHFDMMNQRWLLSSDVIYVDLEDSMDVAQGSVTATVRQTLLEVAGGYRVSPAVALLVGARWVDLSSGLRHSGPLVEDGGDVSKSWVDPFVGAHVTAPLGERWWLGVHGDIGGFGVGSDLAWQAYADIGYRASDLVSIIFGYRAIDIDYEEGGGRDYFHYDLQIAGPQLGVVFRF